MNEVAPGIHHWTAQHPDIGQPVSSHYVEPARLLLDPLEPEEGTGFFDGLDDPPQQVVLTIGLHWRHSDRFRDRYGATIRAPSAGMHRFEGTDREPEPFEFGDEIAPGVTALEVGGIAPDDTALYIAHGDGVLSIGDAVIRIGGRLGFVPDFLWGDPQSEQAASVEALRRLLEHDFETLLLAHGDPIPRGGREALEKFVEDPYTFPNL